MNLHEYQAVQLFTDYGVPVPAGTVARSSSEAVEAAKSYGNDAWVVKAQIHAGGRGKAGGVKLVSDLQAVKDFADGILNKHLVTKQNGPEGQPVNQIMVRPVTDIKDELYLSMLVDRAARRVSVIASSEGGMDIEQVAASTPEKICTLSIDPIMGVQVFQIQQLAKVLLLNKDQAQQLGAMLRSLYQLFLEKDLSLIEINPLIIDDQDNLIALDAKVSVDDNALYRQPVLADWRDPEQEDPTEREASKYDLNFVSLDGEIGCMVNGAGLAMATMDIIKLHGGRPANFLDVGGGTTAEKVTSAFKLILSDVRVKAILVNIFGGIVRCDLIADGIIQAVKEVGTDIPIIVRLEGTNVEQGKKLLDNSGLTLITATDLDDAADKAVAAAKETN